MVNGCAETCGFATQNWKYFWINLCDLSVCKIEDLLDLNKDGVNSCRMNFLWSWLKFHAKKCLLFYIFFLCKTQWTTCLCLCDCLAHSRISTWNNEMKINTLIHGRRKTYWPWTVITSWILIEALESTRRMDSHSN